jgi:hypothetical protein
MRIISDCGSGTEKSVLKLYLIDRLPNIYLKIQKLYCVFCAVNPNYLSGYPRVSSYPWTKKSKSR